MKDYKPEIEKIFRKYAQENNGTSLAEDGIHPTITFDMIQTAFVFNELQALIAESNKEVLERYAKFKFTNVSGKIPELYGNDYIDEMESVKKFLSQDTQPKEGNENITQKRQ